MAQRIIYNIKLNCSIDRVYTKARHAMVTMTYASDQDSVPWHLLLIWTILLLPLVKLELRKVNFRQRSYFRSVEEPETTP